MKTLVGRLDASASLRALLAIGTLVAPYTVHPPGAHADPAQVLIVGDSLASGMKPFLGEMITDREVTFDAKAGRTTPQGIAALRHDLRRYAPQTVVVNLGTNDGSDPAKFGARIDRVLRMVPADACVIWPAIARGPHKGPYVALNRVLRDAARHESRLKVIPWDRMVRKGTVRLHDGVHPTVAGYRFRAYVTAAAVQRGCI